MRSNKQTQEVLFEKVVKTGIRILHDKELSDNYDNAHEVLKDYLLFEDNGRRRPALEPEGRKAPLESFRLIKG